jgi:tetratricopeptide (TPR) repeat protein
MRVFRFSHFLFFILCVALYGAVEISAQRPGTAQPRVAKRELIIKSEPNAIVWIEGVRFGQTNDEGILLIATAPAGRKTVRVRAEGFSEASAIALPTAKTLNVPLVKTDDVAELAFQYAERLTGIERARAVEAYREAIKLRPNFPEAYVGLARVLSDRGQYLEAESALKEARRSRPGLAEASAIEGRIFKDEGDHEKAIASYKRAISEGRGFQPEAYTGLGLLYLDKADIYAAEGDLDREEEAFDLAADNFDIAVKQLSGAPDAIIVYQLLGRAYEKRRKYKEAIAVYEEFLSIFPDVAEATAVRSFIVQLKLAMEGQ